MARRAKGKPVRRATSARTARSGAASTRSWKRPNRKASGAKRASGRLRRPAKPAKRSSAAKRSAAKPKRKVPKTRVAAKTARTAAPRKRTAAAKRPRLDRARRTLDDGVPTPPSSLDLNRHASAARTGRAEMAESLDDHRGMSPSITGGDVEVNVEDAYFTGDEAPGGDNATPDQDIVDDIGKALGVQYDDAEELKGSDKIIERDRHRWEMDPASSEDYKDRK